MLGCNTYITHCNVVEFLNFLFVKQINNVSYQYLLSYDGCTGNMGNLRMINPYRTNVENRVSS